MIPIRSRNWEEDLLTNGLSERARRVGVAYAGPGSGNDIPVAKGPERPPIAFTGGIPDPISLPIDELREASERVFRLQGHDTLQYGGTQGYLGLREWLAGHWSSVDGLELTPENFGLTNGSAGALENICTTFVDEGDVVLIESTSFPGSIRAIKAFGCELVSVPVDNDGLNVDALESKLEDLKRQGRRAKLLYMIPNFHNPTGSCLTQERRERLLEVCERHEVLIIEDDAYGEIGFEGRLPQSLFSLAGGHGVIKAGSFSKIIAPGLRVGWCLASPQITTALLATRFEMGQSPIVQRLIYQYAKDGRLESHIDDIRVLYERKRDVMMNELRERCSSLATWQEPAGGFFTWLELNERIDPQALADAAKDEAIVYVPGRSFFIDPAEPSVADPSRFVRLAYSYAPEADIPEGIRRLARAMERARRA